MHECDRQDEVAGLLLRQRIARIKGEIPFVLSV